MPPEPSDYRDPPWDAPLDVKAAIDRIPSSATMNGLFLQAVAEMARERRAVLPSARESYIGFRPYLLREHCTLMVEAVKALWPDQPVRLGLRKLGRGAARTLVRSMIGRIMLGSVEGPLEILRAIAKAYPLQSKPGSLEVISLAPGRVELRARRIHHFLDSHHVGVFEGVLKYAEVLEPRVRIHSISDLDGDLLCEWQGR